MGSWSLIYKHTFFCPLPPQMELEDAVLKYVSLGDVERKNPLFRHHLDALLELDSCSSSDDEDASSTSSKKKKGRGKLVGPPSSSITRSSPPLPPPPNPS